MYGEGISREGSLLDIGIENGVIQKSGAWFAYGDERLGQGRENAKQFLKENAEVRGLILDDIYEKLGLNRTAEAQRMPLIEEPRPSGRWRRRPSGSFKTCSRVDHARDNPGARAPGRARIFVDGEFWAEIDADVAVERGLREGPRSVWRSSRRRGRRGRGR